MASLALIITIGLATFFNFAIILHKIKQNNYVNSLIDTIVFVLTLVLFSGSISALSIGMVASMLFSIYLIFNPITLNISSNNITKLHNNNNNNKQSTKRI